MHDVKTLADVRDAFAGTQPMVEVTLQPRPHRRARALDRRDRANTLKGALGGVPASDLRETDRRTPITVRYAGNANENLADGACLDGAGHSARRSW